MSLMVSYIRPSTVLVLTTGIDDDDDENGTGSDSE